MKMTLVLVCLLTLTQSRVVKRQVEGSEEEPTNEATEVSSTESVSGTWYSSTWIFGGGSTEAQINDEDLLVTDGSLGGQGIILEFDIGFYGIRKKKRGIDEDNDIDED